MKYKGQLIPVLTLPPQWQRGISATPRHETVVAEALNGREDRRQRLARMLWGLSYTAISHTARETGYMRGVLLAAREMPVAVPFWPQAAELLSDGINTTILTIEPTDGLMLYRPGGYALVMVHAMSWKAVQIADVQPGGMSLVGHLPGHWPAGTTVVPLLIGHLPRPRTAHETDEAGTWRIDFEEAFLEVPR